MKRCSPAIFVQSHPVFASRACIYLFYRAQKNDGGKGKKTGQSRLGAGAVDGKGAHERRAHAERARGRADVFRH